MTEPATLHPGLAAGRWQTLTIVERLANVGSEVDRAIRADEAGKEARRDWAIDRGATGATEESLPRGALHR